MQKFPIGVILDSFRAGFQGGIEKAKALGVQGLQIYAVHGEIAPENLTPAKTAEYRKMIADAGLVVSALCGDMGGGFTKPAENPARIEKSKRIIDVALEMGTNIVTTHIGVVPQDKNEERFKILQEACNELGEYAQKHNAWFAIETGPETCNTLGAFLDSLDSKGVGVNFDPANLVMVVADDVVAGVHRLKDYIVHTHAKDGVMFHQVDARVTYDNFTHEGLAELGELFREVPLGEGGVDFDGWIGALDAIGYHGFLTIEREVGDTPEKDIGLAVDFLRTKTAKYQ
ncbi:MAG: sugar phosphate isomerase/epimerase [Oscillospiraceae bacterium]|nr:sugar phosphate isomerase/epimerase [Oscillospiraceae bacterium]